MIEINDREHYILEWRYILNDLEIGKHPILGAYIEKLFAEIEHFEARFVSESIWQIVPKLIGIDSKLNILQSLLKVDEFFSLKESQIIEIVERDYLAYTKESFGFKLSETPHFSLLFNVK